LRGKYLERFWGPTKKIMVTEESKTNIELDELIKHWNMINYVKA